MIDFDDINQGTQEKIAAEMLVHDTAVALAINPKSQETFYLIKITEEKKEKTEDVGNGFSHVIKKASCIVNDLEGVFLEMKFDPDNLYTISKKPKTGFF